mmetsp:Transcript_46200/g.103603  ORF Transcript_46200/g.103603 Transcript_46200/m.103603 type:complete len:238 (+) Transcript_46200:189-902(+)
MVVPTKRASEHFQDEVPKAFPTIRPEIITHYVDEGAVIARHRIEEGVSLGLPPTMLWAIIVYTMDVRKLPGSGEDQNVYRHLNAALQARSMEILEKIQFFLHFLLSGLQRIPAVPSEEHEGGTLFYRGVPSTHRKVIEEKYTVGKVITWSGFSSVTSDLNVARQEFAGDYGIVFCVRARTARDISGISAIPSEKEAILLPNFRAVVLRGLTPREGDPLHISTLDLFEQAEGPPQIDI